MTQMTIREMIRLVMVAFGVLSSVVGVIWMLSLLSARTEHGVIEIRSKLEHGERTNVAYVVWGRGMHLRLQPGDYRIPPMAGDSVSVLAYGKAGTLKFGRSFWTDWKQAGGFAAVGLALLLVGLYVLRHQPTPAPIDAIQPV
jgi:hypothetical protein